MTITLAGVDLVAAGALLACAVWGGARGSRSPLWWLASLFVGALVAYALYPLTGALLADAAGIPLLPALSATAIGLGVGVTGAVRLGLSSLSRSATAHALRRREAVAHQPAADLDGETWWEATRTRMLAELPDERVRGPSRALGVLFALAAASVVGVSAGWAHALVMDEPFAATRGAQDRGPRSQLETAFRAHVLPVLDRAPHLALARNLQRLARAARVLDHAGPEAVAAARRTPEIRALFAQPALAAALEEEGLARLLDLGDLGQVLRHPRLVQLVRRTDARLALIQADLGPALAAAERAAGLAPTARPEAPTAVAAVTGEPGEPQPTPKPVELQPEQPTKPEPTPEAVEPQPEPAKPQPKPEPTKPQPKPEPTKPQPKPEPVEPQPKPEPAKPQPKPEPVEPQPRPEPAKPQPKPEPTKPQPEPVKPQPKPQAVKPQPEPAKPQPKPEPVEPQPKPQAVKPQPEPTKPQPKPEPVKPQPEPVKPQPEPVKPQPEPAKPQPKPEPAQSEPRPEPVKPQPEPAKPQPKPQPVKPQPEPAKPQPKPETARPQPKPKPAQSEPRPEPAKPLPTRPEPTPAKPTETPAIERPKPTDAPRPVDARELEPLAPAARAEPVLPPAPAAIEALYPASNRFATRPRTRLAPGDRFAFRAAIAFERAVERRELRWRLLDEAGQAVPAFTRSDVAAAPAGQRTAFVEGRVPEDLPAGRYRVELTIDVPGHAPLTRQAALEVAPPDLWVRRVRLAPISTGALEPGARASLRVEYEVRGAAAGPARRVTWRLTDDTGAPAEGVGGAQRTGGGEAGAFAFTRTLTLPPDLPRGRYVLWIEVLAGSVRGAHALPLEVE